MKKFLRTGPNTDNRIFGGVCGGIGNYLNVDSNIIRTLFVIFALCGFFTVIAYIIMWLLIPNDSGKTNL